MSIKVRFAPSPTGFLHIGGARTALYNYLFARSMDGIFLLRIEDTDQLRSDPQHSKAILSSLEYLGINWDEGPYYQSERIELYKQKAQHLLETGAAYHCFCQPSPRTDTNQNSGVYRYSGACRYLSQEEIASRLEANIPFCLRYKTPENRDVYWQDISRGRITFKTAEIDDFVILKQSGMPTYNFAVAVDDCLMEISHVIRGDDHISNTPRQLLIMDSLGYDSPEYCHIPMILGTDRTKLSKRQAAVSVFYYQQQGILPEALVNYLALLGWGLDDHREIFDLEELSSLFSLDRLTKNSAVFDVVKLESFSGKHFIRLSAAEKARRLIPFLIKDGYLSKSSLNDSQTLQQLADLAEACGERVKKLTDAGSFLKPFFVSPQMSVYTLAVSLTPEICFIIARIAREVIFFCEPFNISLLEAEIRAAFKSEGIKFKDAASVIRLAITGEIYSIGLFELIYYLGKIESTSRLDNYLLYLSSQFQLSDEICEAEQV